MEGDPFKGDQKVGISVLGKIEKRFINWTIPKLPKFFTSWGLTLTTVIWNGFIVLFGYLAQFNIQWLWGLSFMIFMQWLTDSLDGSLGKYRKEGLKRWGYYMDHFLDYFFLCSILVGYSFMVTDAFKPMLFYILVVLAGFMVHAYLRSAATGNFKIVFFGVGPTEIRLLFILANTLLIIFGKVYMANVLPYALIGSSLGLVVVVYRTQKALWDFDKANNVDL